MKRLLIAVFVFTFALGSSVHAMEDATKIEKKYFDQDGVLVTEQQFFDENGLVIKGITEKGKVPSVEDINLKAAASGPGWWTINTTTFRQWESGWIQMRIHGTGKSESWTDTSKRAYYAIDKIGVSTQLYHGNNIHDTQSSTLTNAAQVAVTASQQSLACCFQWTGKSNHTFEHTGFTSWYPVSEHDLP